MALLKRLSPEQLQKIAVVKIAFTRAEALTNIPWQLIAAIWYRESFSITPPTTPGGPFQFDPLPATSVLQALLKTYTIAPDTVVHDLLVKGVNDFTAGAVFCACWLAHQCKFDLKTNHTDIAIRDACYGYNGRAWGPHPESSPYVNNEFDQMHHAMSIRGSVPMIGGGRKWISTVDQRPGAFTVYKQLVDAKI